ncbi:hypothetical protein Tco_0612624 [Tanacetum coccineum]
MLTYLKHMAGYKQSQLKNKSFVEIQKLFDKSMTRVNMFVDMDIELVRESLKKDKARGTRGVSLRKHIVITKFFKKKYQHLSIIRAGWNSKEGDLKTMFEHHVEDLVWREKISPYKSYNHRNARKLKEEEPLSFFPIERATTTSLGPKETRSGPRAKDDPSSSPILMLLVYKLLLLVFRVNAAGTKLQLLTELQLLMDKD